MPVFSLNMSAWRWEEILRWLRPSLTNFAGCKTCAMQNSCGNLPLRWHKRYKSCLSRVRYNTPSQVFALRLVFFCGKSSNLTHVCWEATNTGLNVPFSGKRHSFWFRRLARAWPLHFGLGRKIKWWNGSNMAPLGSNSNLPCLCLNLTKIMVHKKIKIKDQSYN